MGNILVCDDERSICELLDIALRRDGVSERGGDVTAVHFVFLNLKNDFAHVVILNQFV